MLSGFQNSLSLETINLEQCWAAWLDDYFSNLGRPGEAAVGRGQVQRQRKVGTGGSKLREAGGGAQGDRRTNCWPVF